MNVFRSCGASPAQFSDPCSTESYLECIGRQCGGQCNPEKTENINILRDVLMEPNKS